MKNKGGSYWSFFTIKGIFKKASTGDQDTSGIDQHIHKWALKRWWIAKVANDTKLFPAVKPLTISTVGVVKWQKNTMLINTKESICEKHSPNKCSPNNCFWMSICRLRERSCSHCKCYQLNIQSREWVCPWLTNLTCWLPETGRYKRGRNPLYSPCFS